MHGHKAPRSMILPFLRDRLKERSELDELDELVASREETPAERLALTLELSELSCELAAATAASGWSQPSNDLDSKVQSYVVPLKAAAATLR